MTLHEEGETPPGGTTVSFSERLDLWNTAKKESSKEQCKNNTAQKKRSKEVNRPPQCLASLIVLMKHCTPEEAAKELSCKYINN